MKTRRWFAMILTLFCGTLATTAAGQTPSQNPNLQVRFLLHKQVAAPGFGWAGWAVASDVANPFGQRGLLVAGVGYKWQSGPSTALRVNWIEVMPGAFVTEHQRPDSVLDVRSSFNLAKGLNLSVEGLRAFGTKRTLLITTFTALVPGTDGRLRVGGESDLIFKQGRDSPGVGPRMAVKLNSRLSWAVGYQFRLGPEPNFVRSYGLVTF